MEQDNYTYHYIEAFTEQKYIELLKELDNDSLLSMIRELNIELIERESIEDYEECCVIRDDINQIKEYLK